MDNNPLPLPAQDGDAGLQEHLQEEAQAQMPPLAQPPPTYPFDPHGDESRRLTYLGSVAYAVGSFPLAHFHFCQALNHLLHPDRRQIFAPERQLGMRGDIRINNTYLQELLQSCPLLDPERYAPDRMEAHKAALDEGRQRVRMGHHRYDNISSTGSGEGNEDAQLISPPQAPYPWNEIYTNMERKRRRQQERRASSSSASSDSKQRDNMVLSGDDSDVEMEDEEGQGNDDNYDTDHNDEDDDDDYTSSHALAAAGLNIHARSLRHRNLLDQIENFDELVDPILEDAPHFIDTDGDVSSLDTITFKTSTVTVPSCRPRRVDDADVLLLGVILFDLGLCHLSVCQYDQALELVQMAHAYLQPKENDRCFEDLVLMMEDDIAVIRDFIRLRSRQTDEDLQDRQLRELLVQLLALSSMQSQSQAPSASSLSCT